jgi:2-dehydro-3-deoxyphosphogluconate aldolase/(4S)-4-hydroxy-2-oxoglutarate aldolase
MTSEITRSDVLGRILEARLVGVIRADDADQALRIAHAVVEGGIDLIEVTFTVPHAERAIATLRNGREDVRVGAGTVLDDDAARVAIAAGAEFLVGPNLEESVAEVALASGVPYVPGAATPTEVSRAIRLGAKLIKIFPADVLGPRFLRSLLGPFPGLRLMPTGGITPENVGDWFAAGAMAVGTGGGLTSPARAGDYEGVTAVARRYLEAVERAPR